MAKHNKPESNPLPAKPEIERTVLGLVLLNPELFYELSADLRPDDFIVDSNRKIFRAMIELVGSQRELDAVALMSYLQDKKEIELVGGFGYVSGLIDGVPDRPHLEMYIGELREASRRRQVIQMCNSARAQAEDLSESVSWVLSGLYEDLLRVQGEGKRQQGKFIHEFSGDVLQTVVDEMYSERDVLGLSLGLQTVNESTTGLRKGEVCTIGGFPGAGKTAYMLTIAAENARNAVPVCIFSREMAKEQLLLRLWAAESGIRYSALRNPKNLHSDYLRELKTTHIPRVQQWPMLIDDEVVMVDDMIARAHLYRRKYKMQLFAVDYLQIIGSRAEKEYERVSEVCDKWTQFAKETGCPVVLLSQLSRPEKRDRRMNFEPNMMMLRSSGKIEQNSHLVLLTHHPVDDDHKPTGEDLIIIGKQRAGHTGREKAYFNVTSQRWEERGTVATETPKQEAIAY